jgi:hypothetical protein
MSAWFIRIAGDVPAAETCELFAAQGVWWNHSAELSGRLYVLTFPASPARVDAAIATVGGAARCTATAFHALPDEAFAC